MLDLLKEWDRGPCTAREYGTPCSCTRVPRASTSSRTGRARLDDGVRGRRVVEDVRSMLRFKILVDARGQPQVRARAYWRDLVVGADGARSLRRTACETLSQVLSATAGRMHVGV